MSHGAPRVTLAAVQLFFELPLAVECIRAKSYTLFPFPVLTLAVFLFRWFRSYYAFVCLLFCSHIDIHRAITSLCCPSFEIPELLCRCIERFSKVHVLLPEASSVPGAFFAFSDQPRTLKCVSNKSWAILAFSDQHCSLLSLLLRSCLLSCSCLLPLNPATSNPRDRDPANLDSSPLSDLRDDVDLEPGSTLRPPPRDPRIVDC
ncbi:hypothetical protein CRG98_012218 [Punica granatum]|uniref:Uncharacterized protein n=1 Tax=Punica granatum TaxID=22663 RepID=A0A2I0KGE3_PUNGR|nr:hypothetical protein CRG98_012218 [Punica granatum]